MKINCLKYLTLVALGAFSQAQATVTYNASTVTNIAIAVLADSNLAVLAVDGEKAPELLALQAAYPYQQNDIATASKRPASALHVTEKRGSEDLVEKCLIFYASANNRAQAFVQKRTGLTATKSQQFIIMHEAAHCLVHQRVQQAVAVRYSFIPRSDLALWAPPFRGQHKVLLGARVYTQESLTSSAAIGWYEALADVIACETLVRAGSFTIDDVNAIRRLRQADALVDPQHASASMLSKLIASLRLQQSAPGAWSAYKQQPNTLRYNTLIQQLH